MVDLHNAQHLISVGSEEFFVELAIEHPLASIKYFNFQQKINFNGHNLYVEFENKQDNLLLSPNVVLLPMSQFNMSIKMICLKKNKIKEQLCFYVDLNRSKNTSPTVPADNGNIIFEGQFEKI